MLSSRKDLLRAVAELLNCGEKELTFAPLSVEQSMSSHIEEGFDGSIFMLKKGEEKFVAKRKSRSFILNVGQTMNCFHTEGFDEAYSKAYGIFYVRDSYRREKSVYSSLDVELKKYVPEYFGSFEDADECVHLMRYINVAKDTVDNKKVTYFLAKLHSRYLNDEQFCRANVINLPCAEDFENAVPLTKMLLENALKISPLITLNTVNELNEFASLGGELYNKINSFKRTLCQGDMSVKNVSFSNGDICVYDWELATYNNLSFDLVSYLVHYPTEIDFELVKGFLKEYYHAFNGFSTEKITPEELKADFIFNVRLYMVTRFHAMISISTSVNMPKMETWIKNWLFLYRLI